MSFEDDLRRFGPSRSAPVSLSEALAYCASLTVDPYEDFSVVTWLTPRSPQDARRISDLYMMPGGPS